MRSSQWHWHLNETFLKINECSTIADGRRIMKAGSDDNMRVGSQSRLRQMGFEPEVNVIKSTPYALEKVHPQSRSLRHKPSANP